MQNHIKPTKLLFVQGSTFENNCLGTANLFYVSKAFAHTFLLQLVYLLCFS